MPAYGINIAAPPNGQSTVWPSIAFCTSSGPSTKLIGLPQLRQIPVLNAKREMILLKGTDKGKPMYDNAPCGIDLARSAEVNRSTCGVESPGRFTMTYSDNPTRTGAYFYKVYLGLEQKAGRLRRSGSRHGAWSARSVVLRWHILLRQNIYQSAHSKWADAGPNRRVAAIAAPLH